MRDEDGDGDGACYVRNEEFMEPATRIPFSRGNLTMQPCDEGVGAFSSILTSHTLPSPSPSPSPSLDDWISTFSLPECIVDRFPYHHFCVDTHYIRRPSSNFSMLSIHLSQYIHTHTHTVKNSPSPSPTVSNT